MGAVIGCLTAVTLLLFFISLVSLERNAGGKGIALSLALGLFSLKNIALTVLYLQDDLPEMNPVMFLDAVISGVILVRMLMNKPLNDLVKD